MFKKLKSLTIKKQWVAGISAALILVLLVCGLYAIGQSAQKQESNESDRVKKTSSTKKSSQKSGESSSDKKDDSSAQSSSSENAQSSSQSAANTNQGGTSASAGNQTNTGSTYQAPATSSNVGQSNSTAAARSYQAPAQQPASQQPTTSTPAQQAHKWTFVARSANTELYRQGGFNTRDEAYSAGADYMDSHIDVLSYGVF